MCEQRSPLMKEYMLKGFFIGISAKQALVLQAKQSTCGLTREGSTSLELRSALLEHADAGEDSPRGFAPSLLRPGRWGDRGVPLVASCQKRHREHDDPRVQCAGLAVGRLFAPARWEAATQHGQGHGHTHASDGPPGKCCYTRHALSDTVTQNTTQDSHPESLSSAESSIRSI